MFNIRKKKLDLLAAYQAAFKSEDGKKVLYDLIRTHHIIGTIYSKDPQEMALKEGERNVVLRIMHFLNTDPEKFLKDVEQSLQNEQQYID